MSLLETLVTALRAIVAHAPDVDTRMTAQDALDFYEKSSESNTEERFIAAADKAWERERNDLTEASTAFADMDDYDAARDKAEELAGTPLEVERGGVIKVLLSTGGPASGYYIFLDSDSEADSGFYWFQDWFMPKRVYWLDSDQLAQVLQVYDIYAGGE